MNYMEDVAKILGLELGEEFCIQGCDDVYHFTLSGLMNKHGGRCSIALLDDILMGSKVIYKRPWKPNCCEIYYHVLRDGVVECENWDGVEFDLGCYKIGNCYKTEESATKNKMKWIDFYNSDDVINIE